MLVILEFGNNFQFACYYSKSAPNFIVLADRLAFLDEEVAPKLKNY
jgi:hypothetical protein